MDCTESAVNLAVITMEQTRYLPGVQAQQDMTAVNMPVTYHHPDLIGSTMLTTDEDGDAVARVSYTAFGETVGDRCGS